MNQITANAFKAMLDSDPAASLPLLLDVRESWEFEQARLEATGLVTLNLPMSQILQRVGELDPSHPVVCMCHHGMRSAQVGAFLEQRHGFASVTNFTGGIDAWSTEVDPSVPRY